jgi:hypothetical protein
MTWDDVAESYANLGWGRGGEVRSGDLVIGGSGKTDGHRGGAEKTRGRETTGSSVFQTRDIGQAAVPVLHGYRVPTLHTQKSRLAAGNLLNVTEEC